MNRDFFDRLKPFCNNPPDDLVAHFSSDLLPRDPDLFINLINFDESLDYTEGIQCTLIGEPLGLMVLDDANNSNPFCYVTRSPARGLVLHLRHDGASAFAFTSLDRFLNCIQRAIENRQTIDDLVFDTEFPSVVQSDLASYLQHQCDHDGIAEVICVMIPLLEELPVTLLDSLVKHDDFYIREALAEYIVSRPRTTLLSTAEILADDSQAQVSRSGQRALDAIAQLDNPR